MDWIELLDWLKTIAAVVIGGLITLGVNLVIQNRERQATYAIQNRHEIYDPIYDEVVEKLERLRGFRNPFDARATLRGWLELKPSARLRVPEELESLVEELGKKARHFDECHLRMMPLLQRHIDETIAQVQDHLDEREWSGSNVDIRKRHLLESYGGDFLAGEILPIRHSYRLPSILRLKPDSELTPQAIFEIICERVVGEAQLAEWKEARKAVLHSMERLEQWLEVRIERILTEYERKATRL